MQGNNLYVYLLVDSIRKFEGRRLLIFPEDSISLYSLSRVKEHVALAARQLKLHETIS